ncbi:MAG: hypothetical protein NC311_06690 [Muribaculaceae bacterium]|nr:hypothetical protein [Muribaculaceae bacterium]
MANTVPFIALMRRATHSGYSTVIMNNRMLTQCYNLDIDSDIAMNYILYIPNNDDYDNQLYDMSMILSPRKILDAYSPGHKYLEQKRKEAGAKPKEASEEVMFSDKHGGEIKFLYYLQGELVTTSTCKVVYPIDSLNPDVANCEASYDKLIGTIKAGGACLVYDGLRMNLQQSIMEYPSIYYFKVRYQNKKVMIPFARSMFMGIKEVDKFYFSVQESTIPNIYVYSYQITKKGITEQLFGYVLSF